MLELFIHYCLFPVVCPSVEWNCNVASNFKGSKALITWHTVPFSNVHAGSFRYCCYTVWYFLPTARWTQMIHSWPCWYPAASPLWRCVPLFPLKNTWRQIRGTEANSRVDKRLKAADCSLWSLRKSTLKKTKKIFFFPSQFSVFIL